MKTCIVCGSNVDIHHHSTQQLKVVYEHGEITDYQLEKWKCPRCGCWSEVSEQERAIDAKILVRHHNDY